MRASYGERAGLEKAWLEELFRDHYCRSRQQATEIKSLHAGALNDLRLQR